MELNLELKLKLTTTSPVGGWVGGGRVVGGWWVVGGWTETKLMLSQLKLKLYLKLELSLAIFPCNKVQIVTKI